MSGPVIDPITGEETKPLIDPTESIKNELIEVKAKLDVFEKMGMGSNFQQPVAPLPPSGPTYGDQVKALETQMESLNTQIDDAIDKGKPVSHLMTDRDALSRQITRLQIRHEDLNPALNAGIQTIDQLSAEVTRGKMPYYDLLKNDIEASLQALPVEQRMNPQVREAAYQIAVGKNVQKIMDIQKEEILRSAAADPGLPPSGKTGRDGAVSDPDVPKPKDVLPKEALAALRTRGLTPDQYYKGMGYESWSDFYEKRGKEYFGEPEGDD